MTEKQAFTFSLTKLKYKSFRKTTLKENKQKKTYTVDFYMLKGDWPMICFKARCGSFSQHLMRENV